MFNIEESDSGFYIVILSSFDVDEFNRLYDDCKNSLRKNLSWPDDIVTCDARRKYIEKHYRSFFGYKAKLQGKIAYGVFLKNDPSRMIMYCTAEKNMLLQSLNIKITMFGKNKYGLKSWIVDFYPVASELMKPLLDTLKLRSWYYELNQDSDFIQKNLYGIGGVTRNSNILGESSNKANKVIVTSTYGW
jgi:hypothetical protein